ncbi:MAG: hypothetical protein DRR19_17535 [Candidatus Parabeggiatoa sp. nov. 1]|nr:MAG: hypothetical protein DRR19_17535 [Gammaproteobacteria bacterium]
MKIFFAFYLCVALAINTTTLAAAEQNLLFQAQRAFDHGKFSDAIVRWEKILPKLSPRQQINVLLNLATAYQSLGMTDNSLAILKNQALPVAQKTGDKIRESLVLAHLSDVYLLTRYLDNAKNSAQKSVALACASQSPLACATALNYCANLLSTQLKNLSTEPVLFRTICGCAGVSCQAVDKYCANSICATP